MARQINIRSKKNTISFQIDVKPLLVTLFLFILTAAALFAGPGLGDPFFNPVEIGQSLFGIGSGGNEFIINTLRFPRAAVSLLAGLCLGTAGAILQGIVRNPLASPDIIGITGGAAVAAVIYITFFQDSFGIQWLPFTAIGGALMASLLIFLISWNEGVTPIRLVLIGIGVSAAINACTMLILTLSPDYSASQAYIWLTGSIYGASWENLRLLLPWAVLIVPMTVIYSSVLNVQELGDDTSAGLGLSVQKHRIVLLLCSVVLAGAAVSVVGTIGFVGLVAPHIARLLVGRSFPYLLPSAGFVGALIVFSADIVARTAFYPSDIPAGIFTAGIGAPFFIYLLVKHRNKF
ncbi:iron chelate uptake ABC transporter family permease subunit [Halobacillus sp. A5]|uniref:FecCD family ABC transporter permease n=1 Tax=Halobacillus sp. A5 TaxID=2880263 RepID=UPI0020A6CA1B|nr:iron ABC transporter permease [Halobacillus sp. A5]MCP3027800.1 iron ABC transporter permease [Halobacillus sp. A5]